MGRGKGKGKKQSAVVDHDDTGSGEDDKLLVRRRGRPQKPLKGDIEEEDKIVKIEKEDNEIEELTKSTKSQAAPRNGRKRKRPSQANENAESTEDENSAKINGSNLIKSVGYRQNGSRRKNKPRRAAEVGVECT